MISFIQYIKSNRRRKQRQKKAVTRFVRKKMSILEELPPFTCLVQKQPKNNASTLSISWLYVQT